MHAAHRQEGAAHVGIFSHLEVQYLAPLHTRCRGVGVFAGGGTGLAAHAAVYIDDHGILRHAVASIFLMLTRVRSAPEPVESVRSSNMGTSELMLGTPKSLARGVAQ